MRMPFAHLTASWLEPDGLANRDHKIVAMVKTREDATHAPDSAGATFITVHRQTAAQEAPSVRRSEGALKTPLSGRSKKRPA